MKYNDLKTQASILSKAFGNKVLKDLNLNNPPAKFLPEGSESWFLMFDWKKLATNYPEACRIAIDALKKDRGDAFFNCLEGKLDDKHLRQLAPRNIDGVVAAQLGTKYRGKSVEEVRKVVKKHKCPECETSMSIGSPIYCPRHNYLNGKSQCCNAKEVSSGIPFDGTNAMHTKMCAKCGDVFVPKQPLCELETLLGVFEIVIILLANPGIKYEDEYFGIDCGGDEWSPGEDGVFSESPCLYFSVWVDERAEFSARLVAYAHVYFGLASGFFPRSDIESRPLGAFNPLSLESAIKTVKEAGYQVIKII